MNHIKNYFEIQQARYPDNFFAMVEYDEEVGDCLVPPLLVQNFAENAIKHSLKIGNSIDIIVIAQKTEDLVGPYELHDFFLYYMLRCGYAPDKIYRIAELTFSGKYDSGTIKKWLRNFYRRFFAQQFKRSCLPDGPKVGSVAVSPRGDLRMPSDACARIWLDMVEKL